MLAYRHMGGFTLLATKSPGVNENLLWPVAAFASSTARLVR